MKVKSDIKLDFDTTSPYLKEIKNESFSKKLIRELTKYGMEYCIDILKNYNPDLNKLQNFSQDDFSKLRLSENDKNKIMKIISEIRENEDYLQLLHDINTFNDQENNGNDL